MKIAHIFANSEFEPRGLKFIKFLKKYDYVVLEFLKQKDENFLKFILRTLHNIHKESPDILHAHRISGFIPTIFAKLTGSKAKIIYDKHDVHKLDFIFDKLLFLADYIIVASDSHKEKLQRGIRKIDVIHNYSYFKRCSKEVIKKTREKIGLKRNDVAILFQGSLVPEYGFDMLLHSIEKLPKNIKVIVIGWVKDRKYWEMCKRKFNKEFKKNVIYLGAKNYEEMPKYISSSDIGVVLFRRNELTVYGNPNKLFEFFACRVPVIVTNVVSISKYVKNNENSYIVKNYKELRTIIKKLMNRNLRRSFSKKLPYLKWETEFKKYEKILWSIYEKR